jgi:hypothetical protein
VIKSLLTFQPNHGCWPEVYNQSSAMAGGGIAAAVVDHAAAVERA